MFKKDRVQILSFNLFNKIRIKSMKKIFEAGKAAYENVQKTVQEKWEGFKQKFEGTKNEMSQELLNAKTSEELIALGKKLQEQGEALKIEEVQIEGKHNEVKTEDAETLPGEIPLAEIKQTQEQLDAERLTALRREANGGGAETHAEIKDQKLSFEYGATVKVARKAGNIEDDWKFVGIKDSGTIVVEKTNKKGEYLKKHIKIEDFKNINGEGAKVPAETGKSTVDEEGMVSKENPSMIAFQKIEEINKNLIETKKINNEDIKNLAEQHLINNLDLLDSHHTGKEIPEYIKDIYKDLFIGNFKSKLVDIPKILKNGGSLDDFEWECHKYALDFSLKSIVSNDIAKSGFDLWNSNDTQTFLFQRLMNKSDEKIEDDIYDTAIALGGNDSDNVRIIIKERLNTLSSLKEELMSRSKDFGLADSLKEKMEKSIAEVDRISKIIEEMKSVGIVEPDSKEKQQEQQEKTPEEIEYEELKGTIDFDEDGKIPSIFHVLRNNPVAMLEAYKKNKKNIRLLSKQLSEDPKFIEQLKNAGADVEDGVLRKSGFSSFESIDINEKPTQENINNARSETVAFNLARGSRSLEEMGVDKDFARVAIKGSLIKDLNKFFGNGGTFNGEKQIKTACEAIGINMEELKNDPDVRQAIVETAIPRFCSHIAGDRSSSEWVGSLINNLSRTFDVTKEDWEKAMLNPVSGNNVREYYNSRSRGF